MKRSLTISIALICAATSARAGLFGPSNYDECLLDGAKSAQSEAAVQLVVAACSNKFPTKDSSGQTVSEGKYRIFSAISANRPSVNAIVSNIDAVRAKTTRHKLLITATNKNRFSITGGLVGFPNTKGKNCSWNQDDYAEIYYCAGGIAKGQTGVLECDIPDVGTRKISYCLIGFQVYGTDAEIADFMKRENIPSLKSLGR